jgi:hypothetical protein
VESREQDDLAHHGGIGEAGRHYWRNPWCRCPAMRGADPGLVRCPSR